MNNVFQIGGQVSGASFIGRKDFISSIRNSIINTDMRTAKSIVGLTRMGKSSAVINSFYDLPDNIIYVYEDLNEWSEYNELWQDICLNIKDRLEEKRIDYSDIKDGLASMEADELPWIKMSRNVKKIFSYLSDIGIKVILVLDEFDNASALFNEGTKHFELFRTIFSDGKYNVSAVTISRRNLYTIEGATYQSSTFHGVLDIVPFKGFDDKDMAEYFDVFSQNGITLSNEQKEKIVYYAGNAPYLLSILGHYIINAASTHEIIDIDEIFLSKCKSINDYYRDCIKHLKRDDDLKRIVPFIIGPNIGVTQNDKDELYNLGYFRNVKGKLVAISQYFSDYLSASTLNLTIWDNIISLEKKLKQLIEREMTRVVNHYTAGGININEIFRTIMEKTPGIAQGDISRYDAFIQKNQKIFNVDSSYLDVMSMGDAIKIIKECWTDIFSAYFDNAMYSEWEAKLWKCSMARNPVAHGHEEYLSDLDKREVDTYCKHIFNLLSNTIQKVTPDPEPYLKIAQQISAREPGFLLASPVETLIGNEAEMLITAIGGAKKCNLKGVIMKQYEAFIPRNCLEGIILSEKIQSRVKVKVIKIVEDRYEVAPIEWY